jgi:hypothetical protein
MDGDFTMAIDSSIKTDYANGVTSDAAANAGIQAAQNSQPLAPQQPGESEQAFATRQAAYNQGQGQKT